MEERLLVWLKKNLGVKHYSPRKRVFGAIAQDLTVVQVDEERKRVLIRFGGIRHNALPLTFTMFERAVDFIRRKEGGWARLGTGIKPVYEDTVEAHVWRRPFPIGKSTYKSASHICDLLVLADLAEYGYGTNPITGREVQVIRWRDRRLLQPVRG